MKQWIRTVLAGGLLALTLFGVAVADQLADGVAAYQRQDFATAAQLIRPLAEQGNAVAQSVLGIMFEDGHGVAQDYAEAAKWLRQAADQDFAIAQTELGRMYFNGRGVSKDYTECARWWQRAANHGYAEAQVDLGTLYDVGLGVPRDYVMSYMWYNLAAAQGDRSAVEQRTALVDRMTPNQVAEAQRMAREWKPK
jgi:hypothetical protein